MLHNIIHLSACRHHSIKRKIKMVHQIFIGSYVSMPSVENTCYGGPDICTNGAIITCVGVGECYNAPFSVGADSRFTFCSTILTLPLNLNKAKNSFYSEELYPLCIPLFIIISPRNGFSSLRTAQ